MCVPLEAALLGRNMNNTVSDKTHRQRWLLTHSIHRTLQQFADTWARLPRGAAAAWGRYLVLGWLITAAVMLGLVWAARTVIEDETQLFLRLVDVSPISFHAAIWVETPGNSVFLIPVILVAAIIAIWWNAPLRALSIVAAFAIIDTIVLIGWLMWDRQRPTLIYDGAASPGFHSFPSGHVAQTIAVYGLLAYFWISASHRRAEQLLALGLCALLVVAVGLARLCLGTHWPSDLAAGAVVGGVWLTAIIVALRKAEAVGNA